MAGHSKWANIKHRKNRQDAKRGKVFTKLIRAITVAARQGGGDVGANSTLRLAVDKALAANMPRDTVDRAIQRGAGGPDVSALEATQYEGYGPNGVAVLVECLTDNRNRTVAEVRHAFSKFNGNLGAEGSVDYLFTKQGVITFAPGSEEDKVMDIALEQGAEDVQVHEDGSMDVITSEDNFAVVRDALSATDLDIVHAEIAMIPATQATLDHDPAESLLKLVDMLEDLDDVQNVYHNADIPEEVLEKI